jgi:hypothetical protein
MHKGWNDAPAFSCPSNTNNQCNSQQSSGFDWSSLSLGSFSTYGDFEFDGFTCASSFSVGMKRDVLTGRQYQVCFLNLAEMKLLTKNRTNALPAPRLQMPQNVPALDVDHPLLSLRSQSPKFKSALSSTAISNSTIACPAELPASRPPRATLEEALLKTPNVVVPRT